MFHQEFGVEGVKSTMLHGVLDYAKWLLDNARKGVINKLEYFINGFADSRSNQTQNRRLYVIFFRDLAFDFFRFSINEITPILL
jgi:hypothetical protein